MILKLYDLEHTLVGGLKNCKDAKIESELSGGDKTLSFSWHQKNSLKIPHEYYIRTDTAEFVVKENSKGSNGYRNIVANLNLENIEGRVWMEWSVTDQTAIQAANYALTDTGWSCISTVPESKLRNISLKKTNSLKILEKILEAYTCELEYDTINKIVYLKEAVGADKGAYFINGLNLKELQDSGDTYDYATVIKPIGADGLTIEDANDGKDYLENYQYSKKKKTIIWEDTNYTDAQALKDDAEYKLNEISKPKRSLSAKVIDLAKIKQEYNVLSYSVGDTITVISNEDGINEKQRITKITEYLNNPEKNTCEISNTVLSFEEMQKKLFAAAECIDNITTDNGTVNGSTVDSIDVTQIVGLERYIAEDVDDFKANYIYAKTEFGTPYAVIGTEIVTGSTITNLSVVGREDSVLSYITELHASTTYGSYAKYTTVEADNISALEERVNNFVANNITTEYLEAHYAQLTMANVNVANIVTGFLQDLMVSQGIIADRVVGTEVVATDVLTGVNLYADDITAGTLSVDRLVFRGTENSIVYELNSISGALQAASVDTLNGEIITPRTITADRIVAQSITSNEINVANLVATGLIGANRITAINILVDDLNALGATIGGFTIGAIAIFNGTDSATSTASGIYLGTDAIRAYASSTTYTHIQNGILTCTGANIAGKITAAAGSIGGFAIGVTYLANGTSSLAGAINSVYVGTDGISCGTYFKVTKDGSVKATSGVIGAFTIGDTYVTSKDLINDITMTIENAGMKITYGDTENTINAYTEVGGAGYRKIGTDVDTNITSEVLLNTGGLIIAQYIKGNASSRVETSIYYDSIYTPYVKTTNLTLSDTLTTGSTIYQGDIGSSDNRYFIQRFAYNSSIYQGAIRSYASSGYIRVGVYNSTSGSHVSMIDMYTAGNIYIRPMGTTTITCLDTGTNFGTDVRIYTNNLLFGESYGLRCSTTSSWMLRQYSATGHDNATALGTSSYDTLIYTAGNVWKGGSTTTYFATTSTSDQRLKDFVSDLCAYEDMFMDLKPIAFRYHDGLYNAKNRQPLTQWGFYAQDTVQAFEKHGIDWNEQELVVVEDGELSAEEQKYVTNDMLKMNYQNLIALDTHMIQQTILRLDNQEQRIRDLENLVYNLQFEIETLKMAVA